jgi:hypothetical protein
MSPADKPSSVSEGEQSVFAGEFDEKVCCPWCSSERNKVVSPWGGTVSEILFRCDDCESVFGWMKWDKRLPE